MSRDFGSAWVSEPPVRVAPVKATPWSSVEGQFLLAGLSQFTLKGKVLLAGGVALILGALVTTLVLVRPRPPEKPETVVAPPAAGDRLLQSVTASLGDDGSIDQLADSVVITRATTGEFDTTSSSYDPSQAVDQLPVRVQTSYRTEQSSGTDLADLKGYSGRVIIDLTVQNLTVQPQQVNYDAGGRSRTETAMVGAPLTVVASASLPGVDPATVVTEPGDDGEPANAKDVTNGVLGQGSDQTTQVQWATILAPPQLSATATLRLVLDAKNFAVPTIDVGVQPGLVTDPSMGALVDSAFNPKNSSELALVSRTIEVVGDVNTVLARASSQVSKVRKTLDSTSQTLGAKTVAALQADTKQLDASLKQSDTNLTALDKALQSSLKSTSSSTLQQLSSTVSEIDALLGDTSAKAPAVSVKGTGCAFQVSTPKAGGTVYGSLQQVTALLTAYASATGDCKEELQQTINKTIGPADPAAPDACGVDDPAVTCTLDNARQTFAKVTDAIEQGQNASLGLNPEEDFKDSQDTVATLTKQLTEIRDLTEKLGDNADGPDPDSRTLSKIAAQLEKASTSVTDTQAALPKITEQVDQIHQDAVSGRSGVDTMLGQNKDVAEKLCALVGDGTQPGAPTSDQINAIRAYLVTTRCDGSKFDSPDPDPMETRLDSQAKAWDKVISDTDTSSKDDGLGRLLVDVENSLDEASTALTAAAAGLSTGQSSVGDVHAIAEKAVENLESLGTGLTGVQTSYTTTKTQLDTALAEAAKQASDTKLDSAIEQVSKQGAENSAQLGKAFENSAKGLSSAAEALESSGKKAVDRQRSQLAKTEKQATTSLSAVMTGSLDQISGDISSATRDLGSTRTQLTRDLANILLDLGNPRVKGSGVVGTLAKSADTARSADYQLALAADRTTSYGSVRERDVSGIMLRQAQAEAALQRQAELPAFALDLPDSVQHRTVYTFHLAGGS